MRIRADKADGNPTSFIWMLILTNLDKLTHSKPSIRDFINQARLQSIWRNQSAPKFRGTPGLNYCES
jgi:hypothetical protein